MSSVSEDLKKIVNKSMPFPADVISAYSRIGTVFTSGNLSEQAKISRSTAKYYVNKMVELRLIARIPHRKKYQKFANAQSFSEWLSDLIKLAIRPLEREN